jgi:hypothetical protein
MGGRVHFTTHASMVGEGMQGGRGQMGLVIELRDAGVQT